MKYGSAPKEKPISTDSLIPPLDQHAWDIDVPPLEERLRWARIALSYAIEHLRQSVEYDEARVRNTEQAKRIARAFSSCTDALHAIS